MPPALAEMPTDTLPIDLAAFTPLPLDPAAESLTDEQAATLRANIDLCRDAIVCFTAVAAAKGLGGHTGGPYDIVPEVLIADGFMRHAADHDGCPYPVVPIYFDEAGHRVAIQYLMSVLNGEMDASKLLHYREYLSHLPGHPERGFTPGVKFSSGRLGHMWPMCNGVAMAHPGKAVFMFGSDGSQQEGNDAEAARLAVAKNLNVKLVIDDNNVTIAGHPSEYLPGYSVEKTLTGHGMSVDTIDLTGGTDVATLYQAMRKLVVQDGPQALVIKRVMAEGIPDIEGTPEGHDVVSPDDAIKYFHARAGGTAGEKYAGAIELLEKTGKNPKQPKFAGSTDEQTKNRSAFGKIMCEVLDGIPADERLANVRVFDNDLEGSTGIKAIGEKFPEIYVKAGIMERGNFSAAAGFGFDEGRQGVYATFSAFLEMILSEVTMARLNQCNVLCHFSHAGVDDMADNTCHFGINNFFADGGIPGAPAGLNFQPAQPADPDGGDTDHGDTTRLYFPGDPTQFAACVKRVFQDPGLRFVFSNRSGVPHVLTDAGEPFYSKGYSFEPGKDDVIREGSAGYIVSFGSTLYRALAAVETLRSEGVDVGLINKATLNVPDEDCLKKIGSTGFVIVAEEFNIRTGLGSRFGTWLLERGHTCRYAHLGTWREGSGGLWRQMGWQGLDPEGIADAARRLNG